MEDLPDSPTQHEFVSDTFMQQEGEFKLWFIDCISALPHSGEMCGTQQSQTQSMCTPNNRSTYLLRTC